MVRAHPEIAGLVEWQPLARGGFSTVWQARQESLNRLVAVKVDHRPLSEEKERRRFLREAGAAGRLSGHPGIVTVHDAGILGDGRPYLVMDLCSGGSLTRWLKPEGRKSQRRIRDVGVRIADALAAAHARGVLHRDVKPANILIDSYDHPGLADFGLAALPEPGEELSVTLEGMTPAYAPREVFYREPPTEVGDVYSLAATLYALLDGRPPRWSDNGGPSLPELMEMHEQPVPRLPDVDDHFMDVLLAALSADPADRPTAAEFRDQLMELTFTPSEDAALPVAAASEETQKGSSAVWSGPALGLGEPASVQGRTRRRWLAVLLVAALVLVGLLVALVLRPDAEPVSARPATPAESTPTVAASTRTVSPSPTATPAPEGFTDCSDQLGGGNYCVAVGSPECWVNYFQYADLLPAADLVRCSDYHDLQTFAAGSLPGGINQQSKLQARKEVKALCTRENLDKLLAPGKSLKSWDIKVLPPPVNIDSDNLFRCLTGPSQEKPLKLKAPKR